LALLGSLCGRSIETLSHAALGPVIQQFWVAHRTMQHAWMSGLKDLSGDLKAGDDRLERIALEMFLTELLTRVWFSTWTAMDHLHEQRDVERIAGNLLSGTDRVRREVLLLMVTHWQGPVAESISRLDRFRRRSERWTDLLIAGPAAQHQVWQFAQDTSRARDFGMDSWSGTSAEANPTALLVSAGLRVMFGTPWPRGCCESQPFADMLAAILASLPPHAFTTDGHLRPVWDWAA